MLLEGIKFIFYSSLIVVISKYILVESLRKLAENLKMKPKTVGNIAGFSTSVPELLTITTSSLRGLNSASIFNIFSSNIINLIQYLSTIIINKNIKQLKNNAIKTDIILVCITIIIPIILIRLKIKIDLFIIPLYIILYSLFAFLNNSVHKIYLNNEEEFTEKNNKKINHKKTINCSLILIITSIVLFLIGELLGNTLENLCNIFNLPEFLIGILLGAITSVPELITFFESQKYYKRVTDDMFGVVEATNNLLTSNTLNLFVIQTIGILITNF